MIRITKDPELRGRAIVSDSVTDAVDAASSVCKHKRVECASWIGRKFDDWSHIKDAIRQPWTDGLNKVNQMLAEIRDSGEIRPPKSIKRRRRTSDTDGEVDVDRALAGLPDFMVEHYRNRAEGPTNVTILCNVGNTANYSADQIFWRGAAAVAAVELLEEAGYSCDVWIWNRASGTFWDDYPTAFFTTRVKESGDPLNIGDMTNAVSAWFFRTVIFGVREYAVNGAYAQGGSRPVLEKWDKYMDVDPSTKVVRMPESVFTRDAAIAAVKSVMASMRDRGESSAEE